MDYFGNPLKVGTVAVDPSVIPLGTRLYVEGYDFNGLPVGGMFAEATDTGNALKGNRIDIFVPGTSAELKKFGFQQVKVYLLP
ncbi:Cell wall-binding protein YocH precursor [compost metagenome]